MGAVGVGPAAAAALRAGGRAAEEPQAPGTLRAAVGRGGVDLRQFVLLPSLEEDPALLVREGEREGERGREGGRGKERPVYQERPVSVGKHLLGS